MSRPGNEPVQAVTEEELARRWQALGPAVRRELGEAIGRLSPGQLVLAGLGLVAAGATYYLSRGASDPEAVSATPESGTPTAVPEVERPSGGAPQGVGEAVLRGIVAGLVSSGVLPGLGDTPGAETGREANAGQS